MKRGGTRRNDQPTDIRNFRKKERKEKNEKIKMRILFEKKGFTRSVEGEKSKDKSGGTREAKRGGPGGASKKRSPHIWVFGGGGGFFWGFGGGLGLLGVLGGGGVVVGVGWFGGFFFWAGGGAGFWVGGGGGLGGGGWGGGGVGGGGLGGRRSRRPEPTKKSWVGKGKVEGL